MPHRAPGAWARGWGLVVLGLGEVLAALVLPAPILSALTAAQSPEEKYFAGLDHWVRDGGNVKTVQQAVVEPCGELVTLNATKTEAVGFLTTNREEFDFRVDVCVKMTVNRVHKQPEFEKPEIVGMICGSGNVLFEKLCRRSGLK